MCAKGVISFLLSGEWMVYVIGLESPEVRVVVKGTGNSGK